MKDHARDRQNDAREDHALDQAAAVDNRVRGSKRRAGKERPGQHADEHEKRKSLCRNFQHVREREGVNHDHHERVDK